MKKANCKGSCCPDCGMPHEVRPFKIHMANDINPCPKCGATLRDQETGECVYCSGR